MEANIKFYSEVKTVRLKIHPRNFSNVDMIVNFDWFSKERFQLIPGTVIEIYPIEEKKSKDRRSHLLLEVKPLPYDLQSKGGPISISQEVATAFNLVSGRETCIRRVDKDLVALDLVEFRFKDQVLSRSDMWRFTNSLIGKGMYVSRKVEFAGMLLKVSDLWAQGDRVKSGVVVDTSRVVFRSASSQMFIFLQVSCEVWEFDPNGDMYIDKAVDGFLKDLFSKWKEKECNHEVTLILFARKYYRSLEHIDQSQSAAIMRDKRGHYYEDYYKVIFEKETRKEWLSSIAEVKRGLNQFQAVLKPGKNPHQLIYEGEGHEKNNKEAEEEREWLSCSSEGNILEAMNLAINVLESHYKEVSFSTTGQQIVVVSPGTGVYEVDRQMNLLTRERIIDNGIGADLVCLNEQPLHSVPLFKFQLSETSEEEHYQIPHWINYSYYNPPRPWNKNRFKPRIIMPDYLINKHLKAKMAPRGSLKPVLRLPSIISSDPTDPLSRPTIDYDEYDANIFSSGNKPKKFHTPIRKIHSMTEQEISRVDSPCSTVSLQSPDLFDAVLPMETKSTTTIQVDSTVSSVEDRSTYHTPLSSSYHHAPIIHPRARHLSDDYDDSPVMGGLVMKSDSAENVRHQNKPSYHRQYHQRQQLLVGGARRRKSLINPFDPRKSHTEEVSSHNCRWTHTFPRDREGKPFQRHHKPGGLKSVDEDKEMRDFEGSMNSASTVTTAISSPITSLSNDTIGGVSSLDQKVSLSANSLTSLHAISPSNNRKQKMAQNFSTVKREGMDWTSFVDPACLPLTTDYYPEESALQRDYTDYPTNLVVNAYGDDNESKVSLGWRSDHLNMSTIQAFKEMISQRLLQGFQLVFDKDYSLFTMHKDLQEANDILSGKVKKKMKEKEIVVKFSLGRVFQRMDLNNTDVMLTHTFRSKNSLGVSPFNYYYHLVVGDNTVTLLSTLSQAGMDGYNWNYLDQHVCGHQDFDAYSDSNKFWRGRYLLLPNVPPPYEKRGEERQMWLNDTVNEFVKLVEFINHIKRTAPGTNTNKVEFNRLHSLPVTSFLHPHSRSPSPTPTPKRHSDESYRRTTSHSPNTPLRSITEPSSVSVPYKGQQKQKSRVGGVRKARSREDLSSISSGYSIKERESPWGPRQPRTPQPFQSLQLRHKEEVILDLKKLTVSPDPKATPNSGTHQRQRSSVLPSFSPLQQPFLEEREEGEGQERSGYDYPYSLNLIPTDSSLSSNTPSLSKSGFESSLEGYPSLEIEDEEELTVNSPLEVIVSRLFDKHCGVDVFLLDRRSTLACCFGLEAVNWLMDAIDNITRKEAVKLLEKAVSENLMMHVSGNHKINFIDGCHMYCERTSGNTSTNSNINEEWDLYKKKWLEVSVVHLEDIISIGSSIYGGVGGFSNPSSHASSYMSSLNSSPYYLHPREKSGSMIADVFNRYLELNPDTQKKSDRPEWCYLQYSSSYNPLNAYELEFQWMVATASLLNEMIQGLVHKASMCGFSLVPVLPFNTLKPHLPDSTVNPLYPFYHPVTVPLGIPFEQLKEKECDVSDFIMIRFQLIIRRFGFLLDPSSVNSEIDISEVSSILGGGARVTTTPTNQVYVHHTGSALLQPWFEPSGTTGTCGFYWYKNIYYLNQKTTQSSVIAKYDELYQEFSQFCEMQMADELFFSSTENPFCPL